MKENHNANHIISCEINANSTRITKKLEQRITGLVMSLPSQKRWNYDVFSLVFAAQGRRMNRMIGGGYVAFNYSKIPDLNAIMT